MLKQELNIILLLNKKYRTTCSNTSVCKCRFSNRLCWHHPLLILESAGCLDRELGFWLGIAHLFRRVEIHFSTLRAVWHPGTRFDSLATAQYLGQMLLQSEWFNHSSGDCLKRNSAYTTELRWNISSNGGDTERLNELNTLLFQIYNLCVTKW